jgi:hypothetical protein
MNTPEKAYNEMIKESTVNESTVGDAISALRLVALFSKIIIKDDKAALLFNKMTKMDKSDKKAYNTFMYSLEEYMEEKWPKEWKKIDKLLDTF